MISFYYADEATYTKEEKQRHKAEIEALVSDFDC